MAGEALDGFQALRGEGSADLHHEDTAAKEQVIGGRNILRFALLAALAATAIGCNKDESPVYDNETSGNQDRAGATEKASKVELDCGPNLCPFPKKNIAPADPVAPVPAPKAPTPSSAELTQQDAPTSILKDTLSRAGDRMLFPHSFRGMPSATYSDGKKIWPERATNIHLEN